MKHLCLLLLLLLPLAGWSQHHHGHKLSRPSMDSLERVVRENPDIKTQIKALELLNYHALHADPLLAHRYAEQMLNLGLDRQEPEAIFRGYLYFGRQHFHQGKYPQALAYYDSAQRVIVQYQLLKELADIYVAKADVLIAMEDYPRALQFAQLARQQPPHKDSKKEKAAFHSSIFNLIGKIHSKLGDHEKALDYYLQSLAEARKNGVSGSFLGRRISGVAKTYLTLGDHARARTYFLEARELLQKAGDKVNLGSNSNYLGDLALASGGNLAEATRYYEESLQLAEGVNDKDGMAEALLDLAVVKSRQKDYTGALSLVDRALGLSRELHTVDNELKAQKVKAGIYEQQGQFGKSLQSYKRFQTVKDSVNQEETTRKIAQLESQYALDKKNKEIALLTAEQKLKQKEASRQRQITYALALGILLALALAYMLYNRFRYATRTKRIIEQEKQVSEQLRQQSDDLLLNILPAETAEELKKYGESQARHFEQVTVLFADIKNFTSIAERLSPKELVSTLHEYFQAFDQITGEYGLEKIKTIGDAYLCAGGLHSGEAADPGLVVKAALEMQQTVAQLKGHRQQEGLPFFDVRIGIHTGPVVAGVVGIKKFAYDIWGDTVNTAARMEQTSEPGRINISGTTFELVKEYFACTFRGKIQAKNKGEMEMYFVERVLEEMPVEELAL